MIKGEKREHVKSGNTKWVGFARIEVKAVNPTRAELNKMFGKEDEGEEI